MSWAIGVGRTRSAWETLSFNDVESRQSREVRTANEKAPRTPGCVQNSRERDDGVSDTQSAKSLGYQQHRGPRRRGLECWRNPSLCCLCLRFSVSTQVLQGAVDFTSQVTHLLTAKRSSQKLQKKKLLSLTAVSPHNTSTTGASNNGDGAEAAQTLLTARGRRSAEGRKRFKSRPNARGAPWQRRPRKQPCRWMSGISKQMIQNTTQPQGAQGTKQQAQQQQQRDVRVE